MDFFFDGRFTIGKMVKVLTASQSVSTRSRTNVRVRS